MSVERLSVLLGSRQNLLLSSPPTKSPAAKQFFSHALQERPPPTSDKVGKANLLRSLRYLNGRDIFGLSSKSVIVSPNIHEMGHIPMFRNIEIRTSVHHTHGQSKVCTRYRVGCMFWGGIKNQDQIKISPVKKGTKNSFFPPISLTLLLALCGAIGRGRIFSKFWAYPRRSIPIACSHIRGMSYLCCGCASDVALVCGVEQP